MNYSLPDPIMSLGSSYSPRLSVNGGQLVTRIWACVAFCKPLLIHLFEKDPGITVTESWVDGT
jgi:hypothetical protein